MLQLYWSKLNFSWQQKKGQELFINIHNLLLLMELFIGHDLWDFCWASPCSSQCPHPNLFPKAQPPCRSLAIHSSYHKTGGALKQARFQNSFMRLMIFWHWCFLVPSAKKSQHQHIKTIKKTCFSSRPPTVHHHCKGCPSSPTMSSSRKPPILPIL